MKKALFSLVVCALGRWAWAESALPTARPQLVDPAAWAFRLYHFPTDIELPGEKRPIPLPVLPAGEAGPAEMVRFLKESNMLLKRLFEGAGVPVPEGFLAACDPASQTLAVRAPWASQDHIESWAQSLIGRKAPIYPSYHLHVVEADAAVLRSMMKEAVRAQDHRVLWEHMQALVAQGSAQDVNILSLDTRSGQRAIASQGGYLEYPDGFSLAKSGLLEVKHSGRSVGTQFEVDPVIGPDGSLMDLSFALEHDFAPPVERWVHLSPSEGKHLDCRMTDFAAAKLTTSIAARGGTVKLLGVWAPTGAGPEHAGHLQAAFLSAEIVSTDPPLNDHMLQLLRKYGDQVVSLPKEDTKPARPALPPGMEQRLFKVPPDFLSVNGGDGGNPDPFAPAPAPQAPGAKLRPTATDILKGAGVTFPEGAWAFFSAANATLQVTNSPENLDLVDSFLSSILDGQGPVMLALTLHVVQADAKSLRDLAAKGSRISDHSDTLKALEEAAGRGEAKFVSSAWLETRSGQRSELQSGMQYMTASPPHLEVPTSSKPAPAAGNGDPANVPAAAANAAPAPAAGNVEIAPVSKELTAKHQTTCVGLEFEVDPVIGPDGWTIDVSFALNYHYAPPQLRQDSPLAEGGVLRAAFPMVDFHQGKVTTAVTMLSGTTRLIGLWKPEGTPEFQKSDLLQAAFLRADVVYVDGPPRKK